MTEETKRLLEVNRYKKEAKAKGEKIAELLSNGSNSMTFSDEFDEGFVKAVVYRTHRTLQQKIFGIICKLIREWAMTEHFDARNEFTVLTSRKLAKVLDEEMGEGRVVTPYV